MARQLKSYHRYIAGIDVGGTFTDLLLVDGNGNLLVEKVPSTPADIAAAVLSVLEKAEKTLELDKPLVHSLDRLVHGSTVAANAFLERKDGYPAPMPGHPSLPQSKAFSLIASL